MGAIEIRLKRSGEVIARAAADQFQRLGDSYYLHPDCIDARRFERSDRVYRCPDRGISYWVDLKTDSGYLNDICWIYPDPHPAYRYIAGWYGFYPTHRDYEIHA